MNSMLKLNATVWQQKLKHVRLRWLGHVLRIEQKRIPKKGLRWNYPGKWKQGRQKMTLRKTFEGVFKKIKVTRGTAKRETKERISLRKRSGCIILNGKKQRKKKTQYIFFSHKTYIQAENVRIVFMIVNE